MFYNSLEQYVDACGGLPQELPNDFVLLEKGQRSSYPKWKYHVLIKIDGNNVERIWQSGFNGTHIWTLAGTFNATTIYPKLVEVNTSGRTLQQQAELEILKLYKDKEHNGYVPMNAPNSTPLIKGMKGDSLTEKTRIDWSKGMIADVKLDGLRMLSYTDHSTLEVELRSNGNESYNHIHHIREQLKEFMSYIPQGAMIDGELYKHGWATPDILSAVSRKVSHSPNLTQISYYMFDMNWSSQPCVEDRIETLFNSYQMYLQLRDNSVPNHLKFVPKFWVTSYDDCINKLGVVLQLGYEGLMLRRPGRNASNDRERKLSQYAAGQRTVALLKVKAFTDEEAPVVNVIDGRGKAEGMAILVIRDQTTGVDIPVQWGSEVDRRMWFINPQMVIGRVLTYKYAKRDRISNIPIHPAGVRWRDFYA